MIRIFLAATLALFLTAPPALAEEECVPESRVVTVENPELPFSYGHRGWVITQYSIDGEFFDHNQTSLTITEPVQSLVILKEKTCTSPTPTPLPTPTPEPSPSPTPTPEPTSTPTPTPEPTPSSTPSPTPEPTTTPTTQPSPSASATPEATPTPGLDRLPDTGSNLVLGWLALLVILTGAVIVHAAREIEKRAR